MISQPINNFVLAFLALTSKYSTILMPVLSIIGLLFPKLSNAILPWLASILFFLMFFTLLGLDQKALIQKIKQVAVWRFALFQNVVICVLVTIFSYLCGARGELLLAIAAVGATAPLFGSGAIVNAMGFEALLAMAKTIVATLLLPVTLYVVLITLADDEAYLDMNEYMQRLGIYVLCPMLLAAIVKWLLPTQILNTYYPKIAQFNVLLVLAFPLGLMGGFRKTIDTNPAQGLLLFGIALALVIFIFIATYLVYRKNGRQAASIAATVSSGRNVLLTYTIALPFLGTLFLPLVGALQLPMFSVPFFGKWLIESSKSKKVK